MKLHYFDSVSAGELHLTINESDFDSLFYQRDRKDKFLTIAWNNGGDQKVTIDGITSTFPSQSILPLMANQSFNFGKPEQIIAWQHNRNFYCIINHDKEVSCVGFLFYGSADTMFIYLDEQQQRKLNLLLQVFIDEFEDKDIIQRWKKRSN